MTYKSERKYCLLLIISRFIQNEYLKNVHDLLFPEMIEKLEWLTIFPLGINRVCKCMQSSVVATVMFGPTKPKTFAICPFTKNIFQLLV